MKPNKSLLPIVSIGIVLLGGLVLFTLLANRPQASPEVAMWSQQPPVENGDVEQGRQLILNYGCASCHVIPGIQRSEAYVGSPLNSWAHRSYIAGHLPNTLENLTAWIIDPHSIEPNTAMPALGVSEEEALHISAYLYSLRARE
jgi:cytochrome c